jgi:hypothetical protein
MGEKSVSEEEERLQQLEKQVRELRMTSLAGAVGVVVLCLFTLFRILSGSVPDEIRAKRIAVIDPQGKPAIELAIREDNPRFSFRDIEGNLRAVFELQGEGRPVLTFLDKERHYRATFGLSDEGNPGIAFWDNDYRLRANFKLAGGGEPALGLFSREGEEGSSAVLYLSDERGPILSMRDAAGQDWSIP